MFGLWGLAFGIILLAFGVFAIFFFPSSQTHQEESLAVGGVVMGVIAIVIGAMLVFW
ncbi:MAG: hypothetical protein JW789_03605 [Candidatus Aenigmarchaeota archaeon]|nr:hypothetical protein [Candidatus Aenigmarchaeota archaeon]